MKIIRNDKKAQLTRDQVEAFVAGYRTREDMIEGKRFSYAYDLSRAGNCDVIGLFAMSFMDDQAKGLYDHPMAQIWRSFFIFFRGNELSMLEVTDDCNFTLSPASLDQARGPQISFGMGHINLPANLPHEVSAPVNFTSRNSLMMAGCAAYHAASMIESMQEYVSIQWANNRRAWLAKKQTDAIPQH